MPHESPRRRLPELELAGVERLLIDGNNLLHRISGSPDAAARRLLIARLRAALPPTVATTLLLDGPPDPGAPMTAKISPSLHLRHAGPMGADAVIVSLVEGRPFAVRSRTAVVTDDRALGDRVRTAGAAVHRLGWLQGLLASVEGPRAAGSGLGSGARPRSVPDARPPVDDEADSPSWRPGRGATAKRGNPRRRTGRGGG